jgi:hypothetical protein
MLKLEKFSTAEGKYPESWAPFLHILDELSEEGEWETAATVATRVLKAFLWSADRIAFLAAESDGQYADTTQFVRNWGHYAQSTVRVESGLQQHGEQVAQSILQQKDKLYCFNCNNRNHVNSMCFVKSNKNRIRGRMKPDDEDWSSRPQRGLSREQGFGRSQSRITRDRDLDRRDSRFRR